VTTVAVISDIHGNLPALQAVMSDIAARGITRVVNLGDLVSGPLWPSETLALLMRQPWTHVAGNHDRQVARDEPATLGASDRFAYESINEEQRRWLATLPPTATLEDGIFLCHGTPADDRVYLLEKVENGRLRIAAPTEIDAHLGNVSANVILCGHSHVPRLARTTRAPMIVNPGSVGLPAFRDDAPPVHVSETGSPHARYAILARDAAWRVTFVHVAYDHRAAAARAAENARPDWEIAIRTGYMMP
jgi:predicted phosphodiesterase